MTGESSIARREREPFTSLQRAVDSLFEDFSKRFELPLTVRSLGGNAPFVPSLDVAEDEKELTATTELPGIDEKDVDVSISNGILLVKGEKKEEKEEKKKNYYRMERSYGSFQRSVALPCEVDEDKIVAEFKKGVLTITLPKSAQARKKTKKIEVKAD